MARSSYDDLHDRLDAIDTKKAGTRYERLVALVQKSLDETAGVSHDLRLVGEDTQVKHQIDVTITRNDERRRVLIECKDFDISGDLVGLGIIRDFYGVVDDVKPDEAIVITCNGFTEEARRYAKGKGIKLAVLRRHTDKDDEGTIKKVQITGMISMPFDYRATIKFLDEAGLAAFNTGAAASNAIDDSAGPNTADRDTDLYLHRPGHERIQFVLALNGLFNDRDATQDEALDNETWRTVIALTGCSVQYGDEALIPINSVEIRYQLATEVLTFEIHAPLVALILTPVGEDTDLLIHEDTLKRFRIDAETGEVHRIDDIVRHVSG